MSTLTSRVAVVVLVLLGPVTACEASSTPAPGYTCRSTPEAPHVSAGAKRRGFLSIDAKVRTTCTKLLDSFLLTMLLERKKGDDWVRMQLDSDGRVPRPGKVQTSQVEWDGCIPGDWRITIGGHATLGARTAEIPKVTRVGEIKPADCRLP